MNKKLCLVATAPALMYLFNRSLIPALLADGWEITGVTSAGQPGFGEDDYYAKLQRLGVKMVAIPISRDPRLFRDLWCFFRLWIFFLRNRFDVVHASHPKAVLLAPLAAFFACHPNRVITIRGRVYENAVGWKRRIFAALDRLSCFLCRRVIVVSHSLREAMLKDNIGTPQTLTVIGNGGSQGCDAAFFDRNLVPEENVKKLRRQCGLSEHDRVILFAGRQRKDKGIVELVQAFVNISSDFESNNSDHSDNPRNNEQWRLALVGHEESASDVGETTRETIRNHPHIHTLDWLSDLRTAYKMADIFVLPTWREGFPNTVLEASAMRLPVVTTTAIGAVDSVIDGKTGFLAPINNAEQLAEKIRLLINSPTLRDEMGNAGRNRVLQDFSPKIIRRKILELYGTMTK
ncbi:MAG: glycosyltransferase family 4 protein [Planctomycetaceae bacterium]|jgi:glycosyltransferase involved in cell wall biosynthesis|nr:glycosyltransferase family 4 protein [Planctomycetaceae bacterium]